MMTKKTIVFVFIGMMIIVPAMTNSSRHSRRHGSILQALKETNSPSIDLNNPFVTETVQMASLDIPSLYFDESTQEIPTGSLQEKSTDSTLDEDSQQALGYELPKELQQQAQIELEKVEQKVADDEKIELQFENADLQNLVQQIEELFHVTFISDEAIDPLPKSTPASPTKALKGNKITFKTSTPLTRQQAWDIFLTFLQVSGFSVVQQPNPTIYRIQTIKSSQKAPLPTFIGVDAETLPNNDEMIRYLYFLENASIESMGKIIPALQSSSAAAPILLQEHKAFILTDKAYNIKALMKIVKELDQVTRPQAMSVLKLKQADALEVQTLYNDLTQQSEEDRSPFRPFGARKQPTAIYFPENARIIAEPRTNSLILLGSKDAISKIEDFITKHVDVELEQPYSPLHTYQLQYADAKIVADIMNNTTKLGQDTEAGKTGGVRGRDKYLREMNFTPEPSTNKLIIKGDYNDFLIAKQIIEQLDEPQPQVAIEILILSVELKDDKELGVQLRSKVPGLSGILGSNVNFQTSGLKAGGASQGIVTNDTTGSPGATRLLGNLLKLVTNAGPGNTILSFGQDLYGVWGLFQVLQTITNTQILSNPFLVASNKTPATVSIGETRRVVTGKIKGGVDTPDEELEGDDSAKLQINITPQINSDGMIILQLRVELTEFTDTDNPRSGQKSTKLIETRALVADREVLALGGLIRNTTKSTLSKTPILGDIPVLGWLFKNKSKSIDKDSLLILMSSKIIPAHAVSEVNQFTQERLGKYRGALGELAVADNRDPIHRLFFEGGAEQTKDVSEFLFDRHQRTRRKERKRKRAQEKKIVGETRQGRRSRRNNNQQEPTQTTEPNKANAVTISSTPTPPEPKPIAATQNTKKGRSRSLSSFLSTSDSEKLV